MFSFFRKFLSGSKTVVHQALNPPQHIRRSNYAATLQDCLRDLEKRAKLSVGDLFVKGEPEKVASWPLGLRGLKYAVYSKTSALWEADESKKGYITGHLIETTAREDPSKFLGFLHISKNCPGVYRRRKEDGRSVCTTCGDVEP